MIYMVETLQEKRNELKEHIEIEERQGKDVSKKMRLLTTLDNDFFDYYGKLLDELSL